MCRLEITSWDALFPDDKDIYNLAPLPIKPRTLFLAKTITLSLFVAFVNIAVNGISTLLFPNIVLAASQKPGTAGWHIPTYYGLTYTAGHGISLFLSSVFVFNLMIAIRAFFILFFPSGLFRAASRYLQLALMRIHRAGLFSLRRSNGFRLFIGVLTRLPVIRIDPAFCPISLR